MRAAARVTARDGIVTLGSAVLALAVLLLPWYALGGYVPTGWQATGAARAALVLALTAVVLGRVGAPGLRALALAAALALVALRVALPPDFGFDLDGVAVPVERRVGGWVALVAGATATAAAWPGLRSR